MRARDVRARHRDSVNARKPIQATRCPQRALSPPPPISIPPEARKRGRNRLFAVESGWVSRPGEMGEPCAVRMWLFTPLPPVPRGRPGRRQTRPCPATRPTRHPRTSRPRRRSPLCGPQDPADRRRSSHRQAEDPPCGTVRRRGAPAGRGRLVRLPRRDRVRHGVPTGLDELAQLGRTLHRRRDDILAWFTHPGTSNGPTEAICEYRGGWSGTGWQGGVGRVARV